MPWELLRKSFSPVYLSFEYWETELFGECFDVRVSDTFDVGFDLTLNLRSRNVRIAQDARHVLASGLPSLKLVQFDDVRVLAGQKRWKATPLKPALWRLRLALLGDRWFDVRPDFRNERAPEWLRLHVLAGLL
jgi:hypothetical protein